MTMRRTYPQMSHYGFSQDFAARQGQSCDHQLQVKFSYSDDVLESVYR
jgi:hypothetical protein